MANALSMTGTPAFTKELKFSNGYPSESQYHEKVITVFFVQNHLRGYRYRF